MKRTKHMPLIYKSQLKCMTGVEHSSGFRQEWGEVVSHRDSGCLDATSFIPHGGMYSAPLFTNQTLIEMQWDCRD